MFCLSYDCMNFGGQNLLGVKESKNHLNTMRCKKMKLNPVWSYNLYGRPRDKLFIFIFAGFTSMGMFSFQLRRSPYMLLFTDLSTYIFKSHIFDDNQHYFCIQVICKKDQKQRTNACFSFKNQVTPPNKNTTFRSFFYLVGIVGAKRVKAVRQTSD